MTGRKTMPPIQTDIKPDDLNLFNNYRNRMNSSPSNNNINGYVRRNNSPNPLLSGVKIGSADFKAKKSPHKLRMTFEEANKERWQPSNKFERSDSGNIHEPIDRQKVEHSPIINGNGNRVVKTIVHYGNSPKSQTNDFFRTPVVNNSNHITANGKTTQAAPY